MMVPTRYVGPRCTPQKQERPKAPKLLAYQILVSRVRDDASGFAFDIRVGLVVERSSCRPAPKPETKSS
jgi:hypothetical protein